MDELVPHDAPGLPANWLNGWLAAIGVTVLLPHVKLSWTEDVVPHAVFWSPAQMDLPTAIASALPSISDLDRSAISRHHPEATAEFGRNVYLPTYVERVVIERRQHGFLLTATVTDLKGDETASELEHSPFDPPAPRGETLYSRARACRAAIPEPVGAAVSSTLLGEADRVPTNGLGFDARRLPSGLWAGGRGGNVHVDPCAELLVLSALRLFPVRGDGSHVRARGWTGPGSVPGAFVWTAWTEPLDVYAIDAILDAPPGGPRWRTVPYVSKGSGDVTRAYFSEPVP